ncbi:FAD-dependent oxidoreductase [Agrococcus sp. 1P02AA]|uniref:NAD(P)/FAD-dependent oxidoreductase n=1 Tax=Agrococcus sp. 1P02AA TaxID=3132259 RepID=UPI0039A50841
MRVVVIGAGSIGSHVAFRLLEQGAEVELLDASQPGGGTSASSIAWLSSYPQMSWQEEPGKAKLRGEVHELFARLQQELPGDYLHWSGTLMWGYRHERDELRRAAAAVRAKGVEVQELGASEARDLAPGLRLRDDEVVFHETGSGWVDGPGVVRALVAAIGARGGIVRRGARVVGFERAGERLVAARLQDGSRVEGDVFVNAAGSWASHVAAMADLAIPLELIPGKLVYTQPIESISHVINGPEWCARPDPSGGLAVHWRGGPQDATHGANARSGQELIDEIATALPELAGTAPVRSSIGIRAIPPGGPVVGAVPWLRNLYFAVSHGGIGWGPMWGWMAARELLGGEDVGELSAMRPERFYLEPIAIGRYADDAEQVAR